MKQQLQKKDQLGNRLLSYALSAGALAGLVGNTHAQVNYSGVQDVTLNFLDNVSLDLDGDGNDDFRFYIGGSSFATTFSFNSLRYAVMMPASGAYSNSWLAGYTLSSRLMVMGLDDAGGINSGVSGWTNTISPSPIGAFGDRYYSITSLSYTNLDLNGNFPGQTRFAGIRFMIGGSLHYGWLRVSLNTAVNQLIIHDWAYETTPGAGIVTDAEGPVATLTPNVLPRTNIQVVTVNVTFDEAASGLVAGDFVVTNGTVGTLTEVTPGLEYNLVVTSGVHGNVLVTLPAGAVEDMYGNESDQYTTNWFYDNRPPTTTITAEYSGATNIITQVVTISFDEEVMGMALSDINVTNGVAANLTQVTPNREYTVEVTASTEGPVIVELPAASIVDYGNNPNAQEEVEWIYDITPPEITLDAPSGLTSEQMHVVGITFNEEVEGFELSDINVTNGTAANFVEVTPGLEYTVEVTATAEDEILVEIPGAVVTDLAGNENGAVETSWSYDGTAPVLTLDSGVTGTTGEVTVTVSITANENILDLTLEDVAVTNGTADNLVELTPGLEYTVDVTAAAGGQVVVEIGADAVNDEAGNGNEAVSVDWTYNDAIPTAELDAGLDITNMAVVTVSVTFSEDITGLELTDFSVTNGTASNLQEVAAGTEYTVDITAAGDGTVEVELAADAVEDDAGSGNPAASVAWTYDGTPPVAEVDAADGTVTEQTTTVSITFSEDIEGLELTDISVVNGTASNLVEVTAGTSYTVDITAVAEGEVTVELSAGAVTDAAGNENAAASDSYTYDEGDGLDDMITKGIRVFPNPTEGMLHVDLNRESIIRIVTSSGKLVLVKDHVVSEVLDVSHLNKGVYIMQIENDEGLYNHRFIIK